MEIQKWQFSFDKRKNVFEKSSEYLCRSCDYHPFLIPEE